MGRGMEMLLLQISATLGRFVNNVHQALCNVQGLDIEDSKVVDARNRAMYALQSCFLLSAS
jgi:hypothetical protein